jgi:HPr kinase/phosphorylase
LQNTSMVSLQDIIDDFDLEVISSNKNMDEIMISVADVTRPGLQLAGYFKHFGPDRIQIIGNMEISYLSSLPEKDQINRLSHLMATGIPCLILSRHHEASTAMLYTSEKYDVPLIQTNDTTSTFYASLVKYLNVELAPRTSIHGVLVEVFGEGVLITGDSGVGKSETALELVKRGHRLIADDLVEVRRVSDTTLVGRAPEIIRHLLEIRGLGIVDVKELYGVSSVKQQENINVIINLELWQEGKFYSRLGNEDETTSLLGIDMPSLTIPIRPGRNLAIIVEVAAINHRQKMMGYNATDALTDRVFNSREQEKKRVRDPR